MKLRSIILIISFFSLCFADDISEGYYLAHKEVYFTNTDSYPGTVLVACVEEITYTFPSGCYKITQNNAIEAGYKGDRLRLMAIDADYLENLGGLTATSYDTVTDSNVSDYLLARSKDLDAPQFHFTGTVEYQDIYDVTTDRYYHEMHVDGNTTTLTLKKRVISFSNHADVTVEY